MDLTSPLDLPWQTLTNVKIFQTQIVADTKQKFSIRGIGRDPNNCRLPTFAVIAAHCEGLR
ncbi:MAG: hypothetical protein ONB44_01300 [candidate division KSB1 bacterium]|nr:hypothetical protein [candidate division KSB1 bacterium]MDZ7300756.1 hypothetical protein [candidate division KSB1 bacterium]MDZ7309974.1 hypothetical protein [candidate division KSB1 bacterium]